MKLLPTQIDDIREIVEKNGWKWSEFTVEYPSNTPKVRILRSGLQAWAVILEKQQHRYELSIQPGASSMREATEAGGWANALLVLQDWLRYARREFARLEAGDSVPSAPNWVTASMPPDYSDLQREIADRQSKIDRFDRMSGLLWQKGPKLETAVAEVFNGVGLQAMLGPDRATYDLLVNDSPKTERLFIEVTGTEGTLAKGSRKIPQVVAVRQLEDFSADDRVVVALNARIEEPPGTRAELVTREALDILRGLNAVIVPTHLLFDVWMLSLSRRDEAAARLRGIWWAPPGLWSLT